MQNVKDNYLSSILQGDIEQALLTINTARFTYEPIQIYDQVLIPAQIEVGERWHKGELSVAEEHLATQISYAAMNLLRETPYVCLPLGCSVVVTSVEDESHEFGARAFADLTVGGSCL